MLIHFVRVPFFIDGKMNILCIRSCGSILPFPGSLTPKTIQPCFKEPTSQEADSRTVDGIISPAGSSDLPVKSSKVGAKILITFF